MTVFFGCVAGFLMTSLVEYLLHRYYLHKDAEQEHIAVHHSKYNSNEHFVIEGTKYKDVASSWRYIWLTVILGTPVGILLSLMGVINPIAFLAMGFAYGYGLEIFHVSIHSGYKGYLSQSKLYCYLMDNHFIHHKVYIENFGIGSTHWDILLGTRSKERYYCKK